jgi:myo-inositol-1(or 4)-monophosphatase
VTEVVSKAPRDYQTEVDVAVEPTIVDEVSRAFPTYTIKGDEAVGNRDAGDRRYQSSISIQSTGPRTTPGGRHFGMTISIVENSRTVAGAVYDAMLDELFSAEAGAGAYLNGERIQCVYNADVENVLIDAGLPVPGQVKAVRE